MLRSLRFLVLLLAVAAPAAAETSAPQTREEALAQNVSNPRFLTRLGRASKVPLADWKNAVL